jgi:Na+-translocating ferredoxin:NAD+ oxidoreductase subunit B
MKENTLVEEIDAILPQTQCRRCGYAGCLPYAEAIAAGHASINQCPPGGDDGIRRLATLLGKRAVPLNPLHGSYQPCNVAVIDEETCIGCTLCIQACPVDAIVGAAKQAHTVIAGECTGCELCVAPCPVDCIRMMPGKIADLGPSNGIVGTNDDSGHRVNAPADHARARYRHRLQRLEREKGENEARLAQAAAATVADISAAMDNPKKAAIQAALARAKAAQTQGPREA